MKLMCYLICFVMILLMVGCGGNEDELVTEDKLDTSALPVANFIKSDPPNGGIINLSDALDTPVEIKLFFDRLPSTSLWVEFGLNFKAIMPFGKLPPNDYWRYWSQTQSKARIYQ